MTKPTPTAREIAEDLLDRSGRGMMNGDFKLFSACFGLPTRTETFEDHLVMETLEEMEHVFNDVRAYYAKTGVTRVERHIVDAEYRNPTTIVSTHNASIYAGEDLIQQPFDVLSVIELQEGAWRIRHSEYLIKDSADHKNALLGRGGDFRKTD